MILGYSRRLILKKSEVLPISPLIKNFNQCQNCFDILKQRSKLDKQHPGNRKSLKIRLIGNEQTLSTIKASILFYYFTKER